jgi:RNA polymerase sigma factor (sigma-70 family)
VHIHRLASPDITRIFEGETVSGLSEYQLLERYRERHDEVAFEALVARHGPVVLGVCRRMLRNQTDVDDAFQATFLVLVRRAHQLGPRDAIGPWLYGVAARVALRARSEAARRRELEPISEGPTSCALDRQAGSHQGKHEVIEILDQELSRLPAKYRSPLVLCYLEGQTHEEAARRLNWPLGTVKGRLARARDLLRSRLTRRGLAPTAGGLTMLLSRDSTAALERELIERTVKSSLKLALGQSTVQAVSTSVASLAEGVLTAMFLTKLKWLCFAVLLSGLALTGAAVMARQAASSPDRQPAAAPLAAADSNGPKSASPATEANPDDGSAASRPEILSGPVRAQDTDINQRRVDTARSAFQATFDRFLTGHTTLEQLYQASRRWMDAQADVAQSSSEKATAVQSHMERIKRITQTDRGAHGGQAASELELAQAKAFLAEAEVLLAQAKSPAPPPEESPKEAADGDRPGKDPRSRMILAKLAEPLPMRWANDTPLDEVLQFIKDSTKSPQFPNGIPVYVDPIGLQEAERTLTSTVAIDLEGVPLRRTLSLILRQLGMAYLVEEGMIYITSQESADASAHLAPPIPEIPPALERGEKAVRGELSLDEMKDWIEMFKSREQIRRMLDAERGNNRDDLDRWTPLNDEVKKLTQLNDELRKKYEKTESQLDDIRGLMIDLIKAERDSKKPNEPAPVRSGRGLQ